MISPALSRAIGLLPLPLVFAAVTWHHGALAVAAALALWWLGRDLRDATGAVLPALLAQAAFVSSAVPPPLALAAIVFVGSAMPPLLRHRPLSPRANQIALAIAAGALVLMLVAGGRVPAGTTPAAPFVLVPVGVVAILALSAYFRLRRRALMQQDRFARLLALLLTVQGVAAMLHQWPTALLLSGPALAALWSLSRPLLPPPLHRRVWTGALAVLLMAQAASSMVVTTLPP